MFKKILFGLACAAALAGCMHHPHGPYGRSPSYDPRRPQVSLAQGGYLVVDQEPIVVTRAPGSAAVVTWTLARDSGVRFDPEQGIQIIGRVKDAGPSIVKARTPNPDSNEQFRCRTSENGQEVRCEVLPGVKKGQYEYAIHVRSGNNTRISLDPTLWVPD